MAAEILFCAAGSRKTRCPPPYRELTRIVSEAAGRRLRPKIYLDEEGMPAEFHAVEMRALKEHYESVPYPQSAKPANDISKEGPQAAVSVKSAG